MTRVLFCDEIGPPVVGGYRLVLALVDVELTCLHPPTLVTLPSIVVGGMVLAVTHVQWSVRSIGTLSHLHYVWAINGKPAISIAAVSNFVLFMSRI